MPIALIFILEIFLFSYFADQYGFLKTLGAYWLPSVLLASFIPMVLSVAQRLSLASAQASGKSLNSLLNRLMMIVGFFLLIIPFFSSRILGFFLLIPGLRHLLLWKFRNSLQAKTNQYFGKYGNGFQFHYQAGPTAGFEPQPMMKDVTPIDVKVEYLDSPDETMKNK